MKVLYNTDSQSVVPYPRADDKPVVGLDPVYLVLTQVEAPAPSLTAISSWEVDLDSLEYRQAWIEPTPPLPDPDWVGFNVAMRGCTSFQTWFGFLSPLDQQAVVATSVNGNAPALQVAIAMAAASVPYSPASGEEWAGIAATYGIPLTL